MLRLPLRLFAAWVAAGAAGLPAAGPALSAERVPFVGCASDGQLGPVAAPKGSAKTVNVGVAAARQLAYYTAENASGVLAPRGWRCFYFYGSSGASLIVAPAPNLGASSPTGLDGPAVVETIYSGQTSGRFDVAKYAARLFPEREKAFVAGVIAEGIEPKTDFPAGPYPADKLTYKSAELVEFETPANRDGVGSSDRLKTSNLPIYGFVELQGDAQAPDLLLVTVRLPANLASLRKTILAYPE